MSPLFSVVSSSGVEAVDFVFLDPARFSFGLFTAQPGGRGEKISNQIQDPVTEIVLKRHDKAVQLAVKGIEDGESGVVSVSVMR